MIIKEIQKNARERIVVSTDNFKGRVVCSIRVYFEPEPDKWAPTKKGITFSSNFLPDIIEALRTAHRGLDENASQTLSRTFGGDHG